MQLCLGAGQCQSDKTHSVGTCCEDIFLSFDIKKEKKIPIKYKILTDFNIGIKVHQGKDWAIIDQATNGPSEWGAASVFFFLSFIFYLSMCYL